MPRFFAGWRPLNPDEIVIAGDRIVVDGFSPDDVFGNSSSSLRYGRGLIVIRPGFAGQTLNQIITSVSINCPRSQVVGYRKTFLGRTIDFTEQDYICHGWMDRVHMTYGVEPASEAMSPAKLAALKRASVHQEPLPLP